MCYTRPPFDVIRLLTATRVQYFRSEARSVESPVAQTRRVAVRGNRDGGGVPGLAVGAGLVSCPRSPRTKSGDRCEDLVSRFCPHEGLGRLVGDLEIGSDGGFQFAHTAMSAASDLFFGERGKPALDKIDPGSAGGREVHVEPWTLGEPCANGGGFMCAVVVQD